MHASRAQHNHRLSTTRENQVGLRGKPSRLKLLGISVHICFGGNHLKIRLARWALVVVMGFGLVTSTDLASSAATPDVGGDNSISAYVGTGGLLLPDSFSGSTVTKSAVANCLGCTWRYSIYCMQGAIAPCMHAVTSCPRGSLLYRVWFGLTPSTTAVVGSVCWGSSTPVTRRQVEGQVNDYVIRYIPALRPGFDPPGGSLTTVPVIFWTGQPRSFSPPNFVLSGHSVSITATPTWRWTWDDGTSVWKSVAGDQYPSRQITHQYRSPGRYSVGVTAVWQAKYTVSGIGTFDVSGEVLRQAKTLDVPIASARTVLVSH